MPPRIRESKSAVTPKERLFMERELVSPEEVAALTGLAVKTIYNLHSNGQMPECLKFGSRVRWLATDIAAWIEAHRA